MIRYIHVIPKINSHDRPNVTSVIDCIKKAAEVCDVKVSIAHSGDIYSMPPENTNLIIAVGGDGTMLEALRLSCRADIPAMGINLGKVGFLTDFSADNTDDKLVNDLIDVFQNTEDYNYETRIGIAMKPDNYTSYDNPAFNEYVISNNENDGIITYKLNIGGMNAGVHKATALIINVPTGSTAYGLSAGGALILPSMPVFQIIPLAPLSMTSRPIIVPSNIPIILSVESNDGISLRADGQQVFKSKTSMGFTFEQHKNRATILHSKDWNFFDMLTKKLGWKNN